MGYLFLGIICLVIALIVPLPYILYIILLVVGIIALLAGLFFFFAGATHAPTAGNPRYRRW